MSYELVETVEGQIDSNGFLTMKCHDDLGSNAEQPSDRIFYIEVYYKDNPEVLVASSESLTIHHEKPQEQENDQEEESGDEEGD